MAEGINQENKVIDNSKKKISKLEIKKIAPIALVLVGVVIAGVSIFNRSKVVERCPGEAISSAAAGDIAVKYINEVLLKGKSQVTLKGVSEENCLYKVKIGLGSNEIDTYITRDGKTFFPQAESVAEGLKNPPAAEAGQTIGGFFIANESVCQENNEPLIYFFGSNSCPHCRWEHPLVEAVTKKFEGLISLHINMDSQVDQEVFEKYSTGGIPTLVFGCRYFRVGSGENSGEAEETKVLTALICKLTNNQPATVCEAVKDLVSQIGE